MNQGKLEAVKQEMAWVNVNFVGISKLKWIGMGEFKSDDHYIYYCGQESFRRNRAAIIVNKSPKHRVLNSQYIYCPKYMKKITNSHIHDIIDMAIYGPFL